LAGVNADKPLTALLIRLGAFWSRRPARIIYNSKASAAQHEQLGYACDRAMVIPNGFDLGQFRPLPGARVYLRQLLGLTEEVQIIGQVARFHPMKGHAVHLDAIGELPEFGRQVHCVLIGRGMIASNNALTTRIRRLGLDGRIHLLGERGDLENLVPGFDIAVSSSTRNEGVPNAIGEAMACEVPCVVTDVGDAAILVGDTGIVVQPGDVQALKGALERLLSLPAEARRSLGHRARQRIAERFSLEHMVEEYQNLYGEVLRAGSSHGDSGRNPS